MRTILATAALLLLPIAVAIAQPAAPLQIVVLEGEGAVNIIQQKTAVRPLVEVRDANNVPVPGATVTFTIGSGQPATFAGGTQTLTVTTGTTGRAAASGLNATGSGAVRIQVQAAHQGRIATTAITQTNFATAAAAAAAGMAVQAGGAAAGTTTGAGAAAGAGAGGAAGGGISATTIAIVGAAVGGGAVVATQVVGQESGNEIDTFNGTVDGRIDVRSSSGTAERPINCTHSSAITGSLQINLRSDGTGDARMDLTISPISVTGGCIPGSQRPLSTQALPVTGGPSAITFSYINTDTVTTDTWRFTGSLSGNTITGTLSYQTVPSPGPVGSGQNFNGSTTMPVTLTGPRR